MGNHYVPRYYLRGFSPNFGNQVWAYDRDARRKFYSHVVNVGQENSLYSDDLEAMLTQDIEGPANNILDKIRDKEELTSNDKVLLSVYLITLWKRVPEGKRRVNDRMPEVSQEIGNKVHSEIDRIISEEPEFKKLGLKRKEEVDDIIARYKDNPPDDIWHQTISPELSPRIIEHIPKMAWVFFYAKEPMSFLTCDNPVFYFKHLGVGNPTSEFSVPMNGEVVLWATNRQDVKEGYYEASNSVVKEFNRRTASNSTRFVYAGIDHTWIEEFVYKGSWHLNLIQ